MYGLTFQGETTNNPNKSPDPLNTDKPNPEPTIVFIDPPPSDFNTMHWSASHGEISRASDTRSNYDTLNPSESSKCFKVASQLSRSEEASHGSTHQIRVIKVVSIHYGEPKLITAKILVILESNGREKAQRFNYAQFARLDGAQQAMNRFNSEWD